MESISGNVEGLCKQSSQRIVVEVPPMMTGHTKSRSPRKLSGSVFPQDGLNWDCPLGFQFILRPIPQR